MTTPKQPQMDAETAKALADKLKMIPTISRKKTPKAKKKAPAVDDIDGQVKAVGAALGDALVTATDTPLTVLTPVVGALASQLVALGIRATKHVDDDAKHAPPWLVQGVREQSQKPKPPTPPVDAPPAAARTAKAPALPKRIPARAVRR